MNIRSLKYKTKKKREKVTQLSEEAISCSVVGGEQQSLDVAKKEGSMKEIQPSDYFEKIKKGWSPFS